MHCTATRLPYSNTGYFSKIITDYLQQNNNLSSFYRYAANTEGITAAIEDKKKQPHHRNTLVTALEQQYSGMPLSEQVTENIRLLKQDNTFTITTAHQPVIFTGPLYVVYKILHVIKLCHWYRQQLPQYHFVPVFYMGSEDADLDELGNIWLGSEKLVWETRQTGAVGRMKVKGLEQLIARIEGELLVQPYGKDLLQLLKESYTGVPDLQTATFRFIHALFSRYGLVVLIPDNASLKKLMVPVFSDELFKQASSAIAAPSIEALGRQYKVQAHPRAINLFYLKDDIRERIEREGDIWKVTGRDIHFTAQQLQEELEAHPERFSPNVILRGLFQEMILPNIAFVGGGGELAYWLELKAIFDYYQVAYPVLVLRNSFLLVEKKWAAKIRKLGFAAGDFFTPAPELLAKRVLQEKSAELMLAGEQHALQQLYAQLKTKAAHIDPTLAKHVSALYAKAAAPLQELEKKMLRSEKRKHADQSGQIQHIREALFPLNSLQERMENFMPYYAKWGGHFIDMLYQHSLHLEQEFVILQEQ